MRSGLAGHLCRIIPISDDHLSTVADWLADERCADLLRGSTASFSQAADFEGLDSKDGGAAVISDLRGRMVGIVHWWRTGERAYEIGGALGEREFWRSGTGIEAGALVVDYLFEVLDSRRVDFTTGLHNAATLSIGVGDGMVLEAFCPDYFAVAGRHVPAVKTSLTRHEYRQPYPHYQPRVGRRLDPAASATTLGKLHDRINVKEISSSLLEAAP